jgi:hypothetical protein
MSNINMENFLGALPPDPGKKKGKRREEGEGD